MEINNSNLQSLNELYEVIEKANKVFSSNDVILTPVTIYLTTIQEYNTAYGENSGVAQVIHARPVLKITFSGATANYFFCFRENQYSPLGKNYVVTIYDFESYVIDVWTKMIRESIEAIEGGPVKDKESMFSGLPWPQ